MSPGPWSYRSRTVVDADGYEVAVVLSPDAKTDGPAIAAVPELLAALQMLYAETADYIRLNNLGGMDNQCMRLSRAAIAKATGGQS